MITTRGDPASHDRGASGGRAFVTVGPRALAEFAAMLLSARTGYRIVSRKKSATADTTALASTAATLRGTICFTAVPISGPACPPGLCVATTIAAAVQPPIADSAQAT
jgi:hypothetical protein